MPSANRNLAVNVLVSVAKRFITNEEVKTVLRSKYDWNTPGLGFKGKTIATSSANDNIFYDVVLDEAPGIVITLKRGCLKYLGAVETNISTNEELGEVTGESLLVDDLSGDDVQEDAAQEEEDETTIDTTQSNGWSAGEVYIDTRLCNDSYNRLNASIKLSNSKNATPLDYFLFFLPLNHFRTVIYNINIHARSISSTWSDITYNEYLMWIALLTVMTVFRNSDRKAYWRQGTSHFFLNVNFSEYMSYKRFIDIARMHVFEVPSEDKQLNDPLYQIRSTIDAFNDHMVNCVTPGKYLVIDESMNQWLGSGMPNVKKVPRKPHPIGQEFKTIADHHTYCILRIDTVSDPKTKEYDDPGKRTITAAVKRLVKPWFGSGRTVIADSWFGSPKMTTMLGELGLYSIMQVTKRRFWPRGMPTTDIIEQVEEESGSHFTMKKNSTNENIFVCAFRDRKVKAFISSCSTTRLIGQRLLLAPEGNTVTTTRPEVVEEYETHKSSVDAANNLRDNMISYHDIIATERWEMRFLGFILGLCEANSYSSFRIFFNNNNMTHNAFKDTLAYTFLKHCKDLNNTTTGPDPTRSMTLRSGSTHMYITMGKLDSNKRVRLACRSCSESGVGGTRVEKSCSCNTDTPLCSSCYNSHLKQVWDRE